MGMRRKNDADVLNQQISNVYYSQGRLENLGAYLCPGGEPVSFVISGGTQPDERYAPLYAFFETFIGRLPMILLHNNDIHIEAMAIQAWEASGTCDSAPLWTVNENNPYFEPFYGMSPQQITAVVRQLAKKLGYTASPRLERITRAHIEILKQLDIPVSLSGFFYLCRFDDMGEFHDNILALPCGEAAGRRLWADLGVDGEDSSSQFDLFRTIIFGLARDASQGGWSDDNSVADLNCLEAIRRGGTLLLSMNDLYAELLLPYLVEEWKGNGRTPFILLVDGVRIEDQQMLDYLRHPNAGCCCGIISENIVDAIQGDENDFLRFAEQISCFIFYKHGTAKTAAVLSEIMGRYDHTKVESSHGTGGGFFQILPRNRHEDVRFSIENRFRVMPEEIIGLRPGQAIIFDALEDQVIHFN